MIGISLAAGLFSLCGDMKCWRSEDCKNSRTCHLSSLPLTPASTESNINSKTIFSFLSHNSPRKTAKEYPLNTTERRIYKQNWNTFNLCLHSVWRNLLRLRQSEYIQRRKGKDFTIYFPVLSFITFFIGSQTSLLRNVNTSSSKIISFGEHESSQYWGQSFRARLDQLCEYFVSLFRIPLLSCLTYFTHIKIWTKIGKENVLDEKWFSHSEDCLILFHVGGAGGLHQEED